MTSVTVLVMCSDQVLAAMPVARISPEHRRMTHPDLMAKRWRFCDR
jgi:hypothetical protein